MLQGRLFSYTDTRNQAHSVGQTSRNPDQPPGLPVPQFPAPGHDRMDVVRIRPATNPTLSTTNWPRETPPAAKGGGFELLSGGVEATKFANVAPRLVSIMPSPFVLEQPD
ncbi:hypothetical protein WDV93_11220 [Pantoea ananatis]